MSEKLKFHRCVVCGCIFHKDKKTTYCSNCLPSFGNGQIERVHLSELSEEFRKARERDRWRRRMANPEFREHERLRSLARARAKKCIKQEVAI